MIPFLNRRMDFLTTRDVQTYLSRNDMVILPVGSFEMHGPTFPLACDTWEDYGFAMLLAETWDCLVLPPIHYAYPGATGPWPGTVDIGIRATQDYIRSVVDALHKGGFNRVVLIASHGPHDFILQAVIRTIFQETGRIVMHLNPLSYLRNDPDFERKLGYPFDEDIFLLSSLKLLGWEEAFKPYHTVDLPVSNPDTSARKLAAFSTTLPWVYDKDYQHAGIRSGIRPEHADIVIEIMRRKAAETRELPALFGAYQNELAATMQDQPWWKASCWSV